MYVLLSWFRLKRIKKEYGILRSASLPYCMVLNKVLLAFLNLSAASYTVASLTSNE